MNIRNFIIVVLLGVGITAHAQLNVGIKAGLNVSEINGYELERTAGFHAGIAAQYMFNQHVGIESGLYYSLLGGKEKEVDYNEDYEFKANPSYLQMPLLLLYKFNIGNDLKLYPSAGIYLGYGIAGDFEIKGSAYGEDLTSKDDFFNDNTNRFDMGASLGANLQYQKFIVGLAYEQGFLKINKQNIPFEDDDAYNSNFKVSVGYLF